MRAALGALAPPRRWRVTIKKEIPLAAGLGGGSSDAATALRLANAQLARPLPADELHELAARVGADVPFFLVDGPQLGRGDGSELEPLALPQDFTVLLFLPRGAAKPSTAAVYADFDARERRRRIRRARGCAAMPHSPQSAARATWRLCRRTTSRRSPFAERLRALGAFRADVTGAGRSSTASSTAAPRLARGRALKQLGRAWITVPVWYG